MDLEERDPDLDGEIEILIKSSYTYDSNSRILTSVVETDNENDGIFDKKESSFETYSGNRRVMFRRVSDNNNDGVLDQESKSTFFYFNS